VECPQAPTNYICTNAKTIDTLPFTAEGSNEQASPVGVDSPATSCGVVGPGSSRGVWYLLQGDNRCYRASTKGSTFDTILAVYDTTDGCEALLCLKENDDYNDSTSQVSWATTTGTDYYILAAGYWDSIGEYNLTVEVRHAHVLVSLVCFAFVYISFLSTHGTKTGKRVSAGSDK